MSKKVLISLIGASILIIFLILTNIEIVAFYKGKLLLASKDIVEIQKEHYVNEYFDLQVVQAEGKYVLALSILNPDIIVYFNDGIVKNILIDLTKEPVFDELQNLESVQIFIYKKKDFIAEPIGSFVFSDLSDISFYTNIDEAREALY